MGDVETVSTYKFLRLHLDKKLDWSGNTDALYTKEQSRLYFLRRLGLFNICSKLLMFYRSVMAMCPLLCCRSSTRMRYAGQLAGSLLQNSVEVDHANRGAPVLVPFVVERSQKTGKSVTPPPSRLMPLQGLCKSFKALHPKITTLNIKLISIN